MRGGTQHHASEPFSISDLDDQNLNAEFHTMSPGMQRYVRYLPGRLEKQTAVSGDSVPVTRGSITDPADQKPVDIQSKSI